MSSIMIDIDEKDTHVVNDQGKTVLVPLMIQGTKEQLLYPPVEYDHNAFVEKCYNKNVYEAISQNMLGKSTRSDSRIRVSHVPGNKLDRNDIDAIANATEKKSSIDIIIYTKHSPINDPEYIPNQINNLEQLLCKKYPSLAKDVRETFELLKMSSKERYPLYSAIIFFAIMIEPSVQQYYMPDPTWDENHADVREWLKGDPSTDWTRPLSLRPLPTLNRVYVPAFRHLVNQALPYLFNALFYRSSREISTLPDVAINAFMEYESRLPVDMPSRLQIYTTRIAEVSNR